MNLFDKKFVYLEWDDCLKGKKVVLGDTLGELRKKLDRGLVVPVAKNEGDYPFTTANSIEDINYALCYYDPNYSCKVAYAQGKVIQCKSSCIPNDKWEDCVCGPEWADHCEYRVKPEENTFYVYKCSDNTLHISKFGMQLEYELKGTEEECKQYIKKHYCSMCVHQSCDIVVGTQFCEGFKEPKQKRRMTYRELARWIAQGNGQAKNIGSTTITSRGVEYDEGDDDKSCPDRLLIRGWDEEEWSDPLVEE